MTQQLDEERIFGTARKISDFEARAEYLDQVCAGDQALRERVEALLQAHEQEAEFLKSSPADVATTDSSPVTEKVGQQIGRYKLLQKIGEGGFGVVYMAEQVRPVRRKVALKIIKPGMDTNAVVARFEAERQALALMDHPNIARVLDGGATDSGRPYFVMELVKGVPITEYCDKSRLPIPKRLGLLIAMCHAVQHAHQKGIIHRDLKPSNVLITLHDGNPVVKVIDFGVSKALNQQLTEKTLFTHYGQMIGTPQYMSPEQAEMSGLDIDTRTDVYSLGVVLYELLTGTTPLDATRLRQTAFADMQKLICEEDAPKPSVRLSSMGNTATQVAELRKLDAPQLRRCLLGDLDWIVMKSLEKERDRRYGSPADLAADLDRFLSDDPVEARPPLRSYLLRKFVKRNRLAVGTAAAVSVALLVGLFGTSIGFVKFWAASEAAKVERENAIDARDLARAQRMEAAKAAAEAIAERERREQDLYISEISLAYRLRDENNFRRVNEILNNYARPQGRDWRGIEWQLLWTATDRRRNADVIPFDNVPGDGTRFTNDGNGICVKTWGGEVTIHSGQAFERRSQIFSLAVGQRIQTEPGKHAFGTFLGAGYHAVSYVGYWEEGSAHLRSLDRSKSVELGKLSTNCSFAYDQESQTLVAGDPDEGLFVFDPATGQQLRTLPDIKGKRFCLSPDARLVATALDEGIRIWDFEKSELLLELSAPSDRIKCLEFSPDSSQFLVTTEYGPVRCRIWATKNWQVLAEISSHTDAIRDAAYTPDGSLLALASRDNSISIWNTRTYSKVETLKGHSGIVNTVAFSPQGNRLVSASQDYTVVVWDVSDLKATNTTRKVNNPRHVVLADGLGFTTDEGRVYSFDPLTGEELDEVYSSDAPVAAIDAVGSRELAIASGGDIVRWKDNKFSTNTVGGSVTALALSKDGKHVAFGRADGHTGLLDLDTGAVIESQQLHNGAVKKVALGPDSKLVATGAGGWGTVGDSEVVCWNPDSGDVKRLVGHKDGITCIIFSPDGKYLYSGSIDNEVRVWDWASDTPEVAVLQGHTASIRDLLLDRAGRRLISSAGDHSVRIWDLETRRQCGAFFVPTEMLAEAVRSLFWVGDHTTLVGYQDFGVISTWSGEVPKELRPRGVDSELTSTP